jgi:hypothetical protein
VNPLQADPFANLANLRGVLKQIERAAGLDCSVQELRAAREGILCGVREHLHSRFELGRKLETYKFYFKAEGNWVRAARVLATALHTSERTLMRLVEGYESASRLPDVILETLEASNIDPGEPKNVPMVEELLEMPPPAGTLLPEKMLFVSANSALAFATNSDAQTTSVGGNCDLAILAKEERDHQSAGRIMTVDDLNALLRAREAELSAIYEHVPGIVF